MVLITESAATQGLKLQRPVGLLTWLTNGNWPAKVGGTLVIVGMGALLRYALINIDVAAYLKLAAGLVIAFALGLGSIFVPDGPARRPVSLALGGAAFGVAYLTAYSAFGLFNYLSNPAGLALLGLVSIAMGVFAVTRSALSLAMLSMIGAYLAPAFAVADAGPEVVYGYYLGASLLTLVMVAQRGWRPLIHLSFLFALAGGVFFGWTAQYYTTAHTAVMQPVLLLLVAIHLAMPVLEKNQASTPWMERLDVIYTLVLPTTAALLAFCLSVTRANLSDELICLGLLWVLAAVTLRLKARNGVAIHAVIAGVLLLFGLLVRFKSLPWELVLLAASVMSLGIVAWRYKPVTKLHDVLAGLVLLFGALHVLDSTVSDAGGDTFLNGRFIERLVASILLIIAGTVCRRIRQSLDTLLLAVGIVWLVVSTGIELIQWQLATLALVLHWALILIAVSLWIPGRRVRIADEHVTGLTLAILATAAWAASQAAVVAAWLSMLAAPITLIGLAVRPLGSERDSRNQRFLAALVAPAVTVIWAGTAGLHVGIGAPQFGFVVAVAVAMLALYAGRLVEAERREWLVSAIEVFGVGFAALLAGATLLAIVRNPWAIALELVSLAGLVWVTHLRGAQRLRTNFWVAACIVGVALIVQANLMRLFGQPGTLDISDVLRLQWPAVVSLLWAITGSAFTIWSHRTSSRSLWVGGATLLVAAAIKLLLVDFGSLGQLANILAVIAAGAVFLLVGWLAPMPVAADTESTVTVADEDSAEEDGTQKKNAWTLAMVLAAASLLFYFHDLRRELFVRWKAADTSRVITIEAPPMEPATSTVNETVPPEANATETQTIAEAVADVAEAPVATAEQAMPMPESASAASSKAPAEKAAPESYTPPPIVNENGVRTYTQYSYPQQKAANPTSAPSAPAAGDAGLDQLLREGRLRRATQQDIDNWLAATGGKRESIRFNLADPASGGRFLYRTYVVTGEMTFPAELYGAHSAVFLIPRNVARPYGNPGHAQVLESP
ncbi:MAG: DUF2339 domain-containing protein [Steroidobacteraceae bacterium]